MGIKGVYVYRPSYGAHGSTEYNQFDEGLQDIDNKLVDLDNHVTSPVMDHHTQYLTTGRHDTYTRHGSGSVDHGVIAGLSDDDHTQYARGAGRAGGQVIIGGTESGNNLDLRSTIHAVKGKVIVESLHTTIAPGGGEAAFGLWQFGTSSNKWLAGDIGLVIDHHSGNPTGLSYGVHIKTTGDYIDCSSGFVVENFGVADGGTFAVSSINNGIGASALAAMINNTLDNHDQYALTMLNTHGRAIIIQSQGTGESLEIRRNGNSTGSAKSGAHIYINENFGSFGHLVGLRLDGHATEGAGHDTMLEIRQGTSRTFEIQKNGNMVLYGGSIYMDNSRPIHMKNAIGEWKILINFNGSNQLDLGQELTSGSLRLNIDGTLRVVSLGANDSGGAGFRMLRVPNA